MEPQPTSEILHDFSPRIIVYKDGTIKRLRKDVILPPSYDPDTQVHSKDVSISPGVSARIYRPNNIPENTKIPILIYIHGGAYCQFSAFSKMYHTYLNLLVSKAKVVAVSVDYRLAPEHPMPACYDDTWAVTQWVLKHASRLGPDPWIDQWGDLTRVFLAGDSGGGNLSHAMMARAGPSGLLGPWVRFEGAVLVHPFFGGPDKLEDIVEYCSEGKMGLEDPRISPARLPARMKEEVVCKRVLVCVDKEDVLYERGVNYYEVLKGSGWKGEVELLETNGGGHVFHLWGDTSHSQNSKDFLNAIVAFINKSS